MGPFLPGPIGPLYYGGDTDDPMGKRVSPLLDTRLTSVAARPHQRTRHFTVRLSSCAYPASGISKVESHPLAALLQPAMGGLQPASGGHHRNGKARKKLLVVLLAESLPIGRVEKDPVKLQVVYGLGADAGRASLDLLKYELLKAEQVFHRANALPTGGQPARKCVCFFTHNGQYFGSNTRDFIT